ncbi:MAG: hypothetical protein ACI4HM_08600 [Ruminococcus sp.]
MASTTEKLTKLETKIEKRKAVIAEETAKLNSDLAEYDKLYLMTLADKFKLKGKDLFSAIEREHEQLEKLRDGGISDKDIDSLTNNGAAAVPHSSSPHYFTGEN